VTLLLRLWEQQVARFVGELMQALGGFGLSVAVERLRQHAGGWCLAVYM